MMRLDHPAIAMLTPPPSPAAVPLGFTVTNLLLDQLVPARLPLTIPGSNGTLTLMVPSARATAWGDMPPDAVIASGAHQRATPAAAPAIGDAYAAARARPVAYLIFTEAGAIADVCPLIIGVRQMLERGPAGERSAIAEIIVLDFQLTASALGGANAVGCRLDVALRPLASTAEFSAPMLTRPLQQADLARNPDALPLDTDFASDVEHTVLADGTPVGGIEKLMSHGGW